VTAAALPAVAEARVLAEEDAISRPPAAVTVAVAACVRQPRSGAPTVWR
jgi:hypothetical protein